MSTLDTSGVPILNRYSMGAVVSLIALIVLSILWETILAPLRPGGSWMVLKVLPLLLPLVGVIRRDLYTLQWSSMLIFLYFSEGVVRAYSDTVPRSVWLAEFEITLSCIYFFCVMAFLRPYKKLAKQHV